MVAPYLAQYGLDATDSVDLTRFRLRIADRDAAGTPRATTRLSAPLTGLLTAELDGAAEYLGVPAGEVLFAALGRTIARTIGAGVLAVDVIRDGRAASRPVDLTCATERQVSADDALAAARRALASPQAARSAGAEMCFNDLGAPANPPAGRPATGHALELRLYRTPDGVQLEWWYDTGRFDRVTVLELSEQFPFALIELTSEATVAA